MELRCTGKTFDSKIVNLWNSGIVSVGVSMKLMLHSKFVLEETLSQNVLCKKSSSCRSLSLGASLGTFNVISMLKKL